MATGSYTHEAVSATEAEKEHAAAHEKYPLSSRTEAVGRELARYGLVVVIAWIGLMKFTAYEAEGIRLYVSNSPLMSWVYELMSVRGFSALLGVVEVGVAVLVAARPLSPRASAVGSALAVGMFLTTLSFLATTPGVGPGVGEDAADAGGLQLVHQDLTPGLPGDPRGCPGRVAGLGRPRHGFDGACLPGPAPSGTGRSPGARGDSRRMRGRDGA